MNVNMKHEPEKCFIFNQIDEKLSTYHILHPYHIHIRQKIQLEKSENAFRFNKKNEKKKIETFLHQNK